MIDRAARCRERLLIQEGLHLVTGDLLKKTISQCRQKMVRHSRLSCHTSGLLPFAANYWKEDFLQVHGKRHGFLRLAGTFVERLENHRQPGLGFALGHTRATAKNF